VIDFHSHALPWQMLPEEFYRARALALRAGGKTRGQDLERLVEKIRQNVDDPLGEQLHADLRRAGAHHAVLIGIDWGLLGDGTSGLHPSDQLAVGLDVVRSTDDFFSYVIGVDPRRPDVVEVLEKAFASEAVVGVKLYPPMGYWPDDPACDAVYRAAREAGRFVMFHTGRQSYPFLLEYGRVERYGEVQRRWPDLRIILGHAGATLWGDHAIEVARGHAHTYLEVSGWHLLVGRDEQRLRGFLRRAWEELGPERVLFGSDHLSGRSSAAKAPVVRAWYELFLDVAAEAGVTADQVDGAAAALLRGRGRPPAAAS
jgi:predicted TIM-barrel fold metal-dependent hydrolase